jgi:hypothetical protein
MVQDSSDCVPFGTKGLRGPGEGKTPEIAGDLLFDVRSAAK